VGLGGGSSMDMATDPTTPSEGELLQLLEEIYE